MKVELPSIALPPHRCPGCGTKYDRATSLPDMGAEAMKRNDVVVCFECGNVSVAMDGKARCRPVTEADRMDWDADTRRLVRFMQAKVWDRKLKARLI